MKNKPKIYTLLVLLLVFASAGSVLLNINNDAFAAPSKVKWDIFSLTGDQIYPSMIVVFSTLKTQEKLDSKGIGSPLGLIGVTITSPANNTPVKVVISSSKLMRTSVFEGVLPKAGVTYRVYPHIKYDYDQLYKVRQVFPEDMTAEVFINGISQGKKDKTFSVTSLNDCVYSLTDGDDDDIDTSWMFAAYVNENHPLVEQILKEALKKDISSFSGYQGDAQEVRAEIEAIWQALQDRGIKYSSISVPSVESDYVSCQHVRLLGDSLKGSQANCVDGTVLLASILKKIELNTYLAMNNDHMYLGVDLTEDGKKRIYIETTMIDDSDLNEAIEASAEQYKEDQKKKDEFILLDVDKARDMGVMPLKDVGNKAE